MTIPKLSKKRLAQLDGKKIYSTITASRKAPRKRNPKRKASEFKRCYGSKRRVEFVKSLPCAACGLVGDAVNAHVLGNGGMSRKGNYDTIAPLCGGYRIILDEKGRTRRPILGCHRWFDEYREQFDARFPSFDSVEAARTCELAWKAFQNQEQEEG